MNRLWKHILALTLAAGLGTSCAAWPALIAAAGALGGGKEEGGLLLFPGGGGGGDTGGGPETAESTEETAATTSSVSVDTDVATGYYKAGAAIVVSVQFSEAVNVTGTPQLKLNNAVTLDYDSGDGTDTLTFNYSVGGGEDVTGLDYLDSSALVLNGGTITLVSDSSDADLTLSTPGQSGSITASKTIVIDTVAPTISGVTATNADGAYGTGATIRVEVTFAESVNVTGTPVLTLNTSPARTASYVSGSGSSTLSFDYTVVSGDASSDLDYTSTTALSGGTIADLAVNAATTTLPAPAATNSLGANKDIVINTTLPVVRFDATSASGLESVTSVSIPVSLSSSPTTAVTVSYAVTGGTATSADYTLASGTLSFGVGETSKNISLGITADALDEIDETVQVALSSPVNAGLGSPNTYTYTITDDDAAPTVTLSSSGSPFTEAGGTATVTATLSAVSGQDVTVNLSYSGTATNTTDYTRSGASIVISAGSTTGSVTLTGVDDSLDEDAETVIVDIASVTNGTESGTQQVTTSITDDDAPPTVTLGLSGSPFAENGGVATVTATLSAASSKSVTVNLAYSGTAANTSDYTRSSSSIIIGAGSTTGSVTLTGVNDATTEGDETVVVDIDSVTNGTESGTQQITATISDDDSPTVTLSSSGSPFAENAGAATLTATLSGTSPFDVTVNLAFSGTATLTDDYTRSGTSITISAGSTTGTVTLTGVNDTLDEDAETVIIDIDSVTNGTESGTQQVTTSITDDDAPPTVTLSESGSPFAEAGGTATITATLSAASGQDVTVNLAFSGTATLTDDYTRGGTSITFSAGSTTGSVTLTGVDDALTEGSESVIVDIDSVTNGTESGTQQVTTTIADDDGATVTLSLSGSPLAENGGVATVTATLSQTLGSTVTVNLAFSGTATNTSDYTRSGTAITIAAGNTTGSITLTGVNDTLDEDAETVIVDIDSVVNATESGTQQVTASITDDDAPPTVTLSESGSPFAENGGAATVTATLSTASSKNVTVNLAFSGTATNTSDYTRSGTSITINAGNTTGSITLTGVDDALTEGSESVIVDIDSVTNGTESGTQQVTASITDDDAAPTVTLSSSGSPFAENGGAATVTATLSAASGQDVTVNLAFSGTAANTSDYTRSETSITISAGSTTGSITLTGVDDALDEAAETVIVDIDSVTNGTESGTQQVTTSITDDDAAPTVSLSISASTFSENGGSITLTATLSATSGQNVTVNLAYSGTAVNATDYSGASSIVVNAGSSSAGITLSGIDDSIFEGSESFAVDIDTVTNGTENGTQTVNPTVSDDEFGVSSAETLDTDNDGQIDHYRLTFSTNVDDSTFPGYALNATGSTQTDWLVAGYSGVVLAHGSAAPESDTADDNVLYLQWTEGGSSDSGAKPDLTTTATPGLQSSGTTTIGQIFTASVTEADRAKPVVTGAVGTTSSANLTVTFSEAVYGAISMPACGSGGELVATDLTYVDNSGDGVASLAGMGSDVCASDAGYSAVFTSTGSTNFATSDNATDSAAATAAIYDAADNTGNTAARALSVTAGPTITSIVQYDTNNNGNIDQFKVTFSIAMTDSSVADAQAAQFNIGGNGLASVDSGTGGSGTIATPNDDSATTDDTVITIFTDDVTSTGTDTQTLAFTLAAGTWLGNSIELQTIADLSSVTTDNAAPVLLTAIAAENTNVATGVDSDDTLTMTFSEGTNKPALTTANIASYFEISGAKAWGTITSAVWNSAGDQLVITFAGSGTTLDTGDRITVLTGIQDTAAAPNVTTNVPGVNPVSGTFASDTVAPYMVTISNVTPTTVTFRFSEAMLTDGSANAANNLSNYTFAEDPADAGCTDVTLASATVITQDTIQLNLTGGQSMCNIQYKLTVGTNVTDLAGNGMGTPNFLTFIGNEQIKVLAAVPLSVNQIRLFFSKKPLAGNDITGSAGCTSAAECANRYQISPSLGNITSAVVGTGAMGNTVTLTTASDQSGVLYSVVVANNTDSDGFDNTSWGSIRNIDDDENIQSAPGDRASFQGLGSIVDEFSDGSLFDDPFGDGSIFSFTFNFGGRVYLGTNDVNNAAFRFEPDGSNAVQIGFGFASGSCSTTDGFGYSTGGTCGTDQGPNGERGVVGFTSATVSPSGTDYEILLSGPIKDNVSHGYFTQDLDTLLDWSQASLGSYTGGGNTKSAQTVYAVDGHLYVAMSSNHNTQTPIVTYHTVTESGGVVSVGTGTDMNIRNQNGLGQGATGGGSYKNPANAGDTVGIDSIVKYNGKLYMANNGGIFVSSDFSGFTSATDITPAAFLTTAGDSTLVLPDAPAGLEKISPGERGIPILKEYNGKLYMARNVASGAANDSTNNTVNLRGELWVCASPCSASTDWTKLISGTETDLGTAHAISMFEVNGSDVLYVGFDDTNGLRVFRLQSSSPPATIGTMSSAGWVQQGINGLAVSYTKILSSTTISDGANDYIYLTAGTGSDAIKVFRQID